MTTTDTAMKTTTTDELQGICLDALKGLDGFDGVVEVVVASRDNVVGDGANWSLAAFRPRVTNAALRAARPVIDDLQRSYRLAG